MTFAQPFQNQFEMIHKHDIFKIKSSFSGSKSSDYYDRCSIYFLVAQIPVECTFSLFSCVLCLHFQGFVLLDQTQPSIAPDIIFNNNDFNPSLPASMWDIRDPNSLNSFLIDLKVSFISYQKELIKKIENPALIFEVETLESYPGILFYKNSFFYFLHLQNTQFSGSEFYYAHELGIVYASLPLTMLVDPTIIICGT